jgi:Xaa-Pro aminopeptidase
MTHGYRSTEKALVATFATIHLGETEKSLSNRLANNIMHAGADSVAFNFINAGPNTGYPHAEAGDYRVQPGDIIRTDCGGYYKEYLSNVGRTAKVGKPSEEDLSIWKRLRAIHHELIDMLRPGRTGREVFETAARLHKKADLPFPYPHNGHSIGLNVHERPVVNAVEDIPYAPNMVSTVETRARWPGKVGYHMEDLMLITEGAPVVLSDFFDNDELFLI